MGDGLRGVGGGLVVAGDLVMEEQLHLLIGLGRDPGTGEPLGRAYPVYRAAADRVQDGPGENGRDVMQAVAASAVNQPNEKRRHAVAAYDFTFSIPKSASILWGVGDPATKERIAAARHAAVAEVIADMEREVAATRTGTTAPGGAVAQVDVTGLIATAFDHFDSRAGDPHLHTHVVISNKVQTVLDGKWRSLDGRPMHEAVAALSELHEALFADALTRSLGVQWEKRERGRDRHPAWAISFVPQMLVAEFSSRSRHIDVETDRLIEAYLASHGRRPNPVTIMKLRAQATLATRPVKQVHSLADLTAAWRERASRVLGQDFSTLAGEEASSVVLLRAEHLPREAIAALGLRVMTAVSEKRATWRHWNLTAEAARQTILYRFASASDREAVISWIVDAAERASLRLTPPGLAMSPVAFHREDETSVFRPKHSAVFTSTELLDAESRLLERADDERGRRVATATGHASARTKLPGGGVLADDQFAALVCIVGSGRVVDVHVGPADADMTTAMSVLRRVWEEAHGAGSGVGLAPVAAALLGSRNVGTFPP